MKPVVKEVFSSLNRARCIVLMGSVLKKTYIHVSKRRCQDAMWKFCQLVLIFSLSMHTSFAHWAQPGCHVVGYKREITIDGCVVFNITYNACRGFCQSYAIPSPYNTIEANANHIITSRAECCTIEKTHDITVTVTCIEGEERNLTFKAASSCSCSLCRK